MNTMVAIAWASPFIALGGAVFTLWQAQLAKKTLAHAYLLKLFSTFDMASQASIEHPEMLYAVHGIKKDIPISEARNIAYLSMLLDGFQHYYGELYHRDFEKMVVEVWSKSNFLTKILSVKENIARWETMKDVYYGEYDADFINAIEKIIKRYKDA